MTKTARWIGRAFGVLAVSALAAPRPALALDPGDYQVGFVTENTGPIAFAGVSFWRGAQLAAQEISANATMGAGTKLSLVEKEGASDAARSIQAERQFIADRNIIATSCCILSPVVGSLKPIVTAAKVPLVIFGATAPGLPQEPYVSSMTILPGPKDTATAVRVVELTKPKTAVYFVAGDNDAFKGRMANTRAAVEKLGVTTSGVVTVLSGDTDFTAPATQAMGYQPDMIVVAATLGPTTGIIAALRARGYAGTIIGNDVLAPEAIYKKLGAAAVGIPFPISFSAGLATTPDAKAFVAAYEKANGAPPDLYAAQGYTVVYFIAQGLQSIHGAPTREALAEALWKIKAIDHNVYGGESVVNGQAETAGTLIVAWSADGTLLPWMPK